MSEFKGTRNNWKCSNLLGYWVVYSMTGTDIVIQAQSSSSNRHEAEANALLISKAPELLKMVELLVDRLEENNLGNFSAVKRAKELIKKATEL